MNTPAGYNAIRPMIDRILQEGGSGNFVIFNMGEYYMQIAAGKGDQVMHCEAVGNDFLPPDLRLSAAQQQKLVDLNWEQPADGGNYILRWPALQEINLDALALNLATTAAEVYGYDDFAGGSIELVLE